MVFCYGHLSGLRQVGCKVFTQSKNSWMVKMNLTNPAYHTLKCSIHILCHIQRFLSPLDFEKYWVPLKGRINGEAIWQCLSFKAPCCKTVINPWVSEVTQWYPTLCDPVDCSPPGSSVRGILQARILEWIAISSFKESGVVEGLRIDRWTESPTLAPAYLKEFIWLFLNILCM